MSNAAEDIVRRATAAFNAGRRDDAQKLCERGLVGQPDEPMLNHLLATVLFAKGDVRSARGHIETSLAKRSGNAAALLLAARIARADRDFEAALRHLDSAISIAPQRETFVEKARTLDQAGFRQQAREAWQAILKVVPTHQEAAARLGRMAFDDGDLTTAVSLSNAQPLATRPHPSGSISVSRDKIFATMPRRWPPIARRSRSSPIVPRPRSTSASCCRMAAKGMRRCAPIAMPIAFARTSSAGSQWR